MRNPNGTFTTTLHSAPLNYRDASGSWRPIETGLVPDTALGYAWRSGQNSFTAHFKELLSENYLRLDVGGRQFELSLEGARTGLAVAAGNKITYPGALEGVDLGYRILPEGIKETLVLGSPSAPASYRFLLEVPEPAAVDAHALPGGAWLFLADGVEAFTLQAPWAAELGPDGEPAQDVDPHASLSVSRIASGFAIDLRVDSAWLAAPDRTFPVVVDPTLTMGQPLQNASFDWSCGACPGVAQQRLKIGNAGGSQWRSAMLFDIGGVPSGAAITSASLKVFFDGVCLNTAEPCGGTGHTIEAYPMAAAWAPSSTTNQISFNSSELLDTFRLTRDSDPVWMTWAVTPQVVDWQTGADPNHGFFLKRDTDGASGSGGPTPPGLSYSAEPGVRPTLQVTWSGSGVTLHRPTTLHSNGAELSWDTYQAPSPFPGYEIHRSQTAGFMPSAATLIASIGDPAITSFVDTTAAPARDFSYKVVIGGAASNEHRVPLPPDGVTTMELQPSGLLGEATRITDGQATGSDADCKNFGSQAGLWVGTSDTNKYRTLLRFDLRQVPANATVESASLSVYYPATTGNVSTVDLHRVTRPWVEGTSAGTCDGTGASWRESQGGVRWNLGGDIAAPPVTSVTNSDRSVPGRDTFSIRELVQNWVSGTTANRGVLLKKATDTNFTAGSSFLYRSDDYSVAAALRPKLTIQYRDDTHAQGPDVQISAPTAGGMVWDDWPNDATRNGTLLHAEAGDDGVVDRVEFMDGQTLIGTDQIAPYELTWDTTQSSVAQGSHTLTAKAFDNAGNSTTSSPIQVTVDKPPTVSITSPTGGTVTGTLNVNATASDPQAVNRVEFYVDGALIATDTTHRYSISWNTLAPALVTPDGSHTLAAHAVDSAGQRSISTVGVTVDNTSGTRYRAQLSPAESDSVPQTMAMGVEYPIDVLVDNQSIEDWQNNTVKLRYRWYDGAGNFVTDGAGKTTGLVKKDDPAVLVTGLLVTPPSLPEGVDSAPYTLRIDLFDEPTQRWFSSQGTPPLDNPVIVNRNLEQPTAWGLERYLHYDTDQVGAGMTNLVNIANGNSILRWTPLSNPGRGLSTVVGLTYNSHDLSRSPVGTGWSLSASSLVRFGSQLDIHPNKADKKQGRSKRWISLTDGDGTTHVFQGFVTGQETGQPSADDNNVYWVEPDGVHLYLREFEDLPVSTRKWALTRPDRVTFFFDEQGYPTFVRDRNGNEIKFVYEQTPPGEDPGGPKKRIVAVEDPAGRRYTIDYYSKAEATDAQIRGQIERITDHAGDWLSFTYYEDGNLLRLTQGGTGHDGAQLARSFVFTYTTSDGSAPAIATEAGRRDPDPRTPNQSSRIYSVLDPRGVADAQTAEETLFTYCSAQSCGGNPQNRWKLQSRTDRAGQRTEYSYDIVARITSASEPVSGSENRSSTFAYDLKGRVTRITDPLGRPTDLQWSQENHLTRLDEPGGGYTTFAYNDNGFLTERSVFLEQTQQCQEKATTRLEYQNVQVDAGDVVNRWKTGRTVPHISQLVKKIDPNGIDPCTGAVLGSHQWVFAYDGVGNLDTVRDPENKVTDYDWNLAPSPDAGTPSRVTDGNGNPTVFEGYDPSGQPTKIRNPMVPADAGDDLLTQLGYNSDGLLVFVQDPEHADDGLPSGANARDYQTQFFHDGLDRLVRQSTPKSTDEERGLLIWAGTDYDLNDNPTADLGPHYSSGGFTGEGTTTEARYDPMDRPTASLDPEGHETRYAYDLAGRVAQVTRPRGLEPSSTATDDYATLYVHDLIDRVTKQTQHEFNASGARTGRVFHTHFCYDAAGNLKWRVSPRLGSSSVNCEGTEPGFATSFGYDKAHRLISVTDAKGRPRSFRYDRNGNTVEVTTPSPGGTQRMSYDGRNLPILREEPLGASGQSTVTTGYQYDGVGNLLRMISPRGWDKAGATGVADLGTFTEASPFTTTYVYDRADRLISQKLPISGPTDQRHFVHRSYDRNGNLTMTSLSTANSNPSTLGKEEKTVLTYWDPGWIRTSDEPALAEVLFDYTPEGWQQMRVPEYSDEEVAADTSLKDLLKTEDTLAWEYFPDGVLKLRTDRDGETIRYTYDRNNNLDTAIDASGPTAEDGQPIEVDVDFDSLDQPVRVAHRSQGQSTWKETTLVYDPGGNVEKRVLEGRTQTFTYDSADWLETQLDWGPDNTRDTADDRKITNVFWDTGWERSRTIVRGGATKQTTTWDWFANGLLKTLKTTGQGSTELESHQLSYLDSQGIYANGHRTKDVFKLMGPAGKPTSCPTSCSASWRYDARDRLVEHNDGHGGTTTYVLDPAGNITRETKGGTVEESVYQGTQLQKQTITSGASTTTFKYWHDGNGNLDCITMGSGSTDGPCATSPDAPTIPSDVVALYSYDAFDRLRSANQYSSGTLTDSATYEYDALDRLISEVETHPQSVEADNRTTTFNYLGLTNLVAKEELSGQVTGTKEYTYDVYSNRIAMTHTESGQTSNFTYGYDPHGSTSLLIGDGGQVKESYGYGPYGEQDTGLTKEDDTLSDPKAPFNPYRYSGRRLDSGSQTYDMGARRFGPDTSRFLQRDLFLGSLSDLSLTMDPLTQNRYSLAGGNPVSYVEWDGHMVMADGNGNGSKNPGPLAGGDVGAGEGTLQTSGGVSNPQDSSVAAREDVSAMSVLQARLWNLDEQAKENCLRDKQWFHGSYEECVADEFTRTAALEISGFAAHGLPFLAPHVDDVPRPVLGTSGWKPELVDEDVNPARHFIGHLRNAYVHGRFWPSYQLRASEDPDRPGSSHQDLRSGRIAINLGVQLRDQEITTDELIRRLPEIVGDPTYSGGPRPAEPVNLGSPGQSVWTWEWAS